MAQQTASDNPASNVFAFSSTDFTASSSISPVLAQREKFAREYAVMKAYLKEVGIEQFAIEQAEMDKIFCALHIAREEFPRLAAHIAAIERHFDHNPPRNALAMHDVISARLGHGGKNMRDMLERIQTLSTMPTHLLDALGRHALLD